MRLCARAGENLRYLHIRLYGVEDTREDSYRYQSRGPQTGTNSKNIFVINLGGNKMRDDAEDTTIYKVVMNHEEQYSIWPADRENPLGWTDAGKSGPKAECLEYIKEV